MRSRYSPRALGGCVLLVCLSGCASPGGTPKGEWEPPPWPMGHYQLLATVPFRMDTETAVRTEQEEFRAELDIGRDESMDFQSSSGVCSRRTEDELDQERARGHRVFSCQEATWILKPLGGTIGAEAHVSVQEGIRTRGHCNQWADTNTGARSCVAYTWFIDFKQATKRVSVRVMPGS
ncbi:MAG: hypothetical protein ABIF09_08080 [Gemmatimonadota bacterium]